MVTFTDAYTAMLAGRILEDVICNNFENPKSNGRAKYTDHGMETIIIITTPHANDCCKACQLHGTVYGLYMDD